MIRAIVICAALIAAPASAQYRRPPPPPWAITPQNAFPQPKMNMAGTTPQQIPRGPSIGTRIGNAIAHVRGRRGR